MTSAPPPPGSGDDPSDEDPFRKPSGSGSPYDPPGSGSPYDSPPPGGGSPYGPPPDGGGQPPPPPYGGQDGPFGGGPHGDDPMAGMAPLATSGKRVIARVIDMVIVGVVVWLLSLLFNVSETNPDHVNAGRSLGQSVIAAILYIAYDVILTGRTGQTLGKRLMKMRVARLDNGATPATQSLLIRAAVLWLPFAFCCACVWTAICGGWSFIDKPYKQGLHDKAAKTVVVAV